MPTDRQVTIALMHKAYGRGPEDKDCSACEEYVVRLEERGVRCSNGVLDRPFMWCRLFGLPARVADRPARVWDRNWHACGRFHVKQPLAFPGEDGQDADDRATG